MKTRSAGIRRPLKYKAFANTSGYNKFRVRFRVLITNNNNKTTEKQIKINITLPLQKRKRHKEHNMKTIQFLSPCKVNFALFVYSSLEIALKPSTARLKKCFTKHIKLFTTAKPESKLQEKRVSFVVLVYS